MAMTQAKSLIKLQLCQKNTNQQQLYSFWLQIITIIIIKIQGEKVYLLEPYLW